jgi:hypothetical protein
LRKKNDVCPKIFHYLETAKHHFLKPVPNVPRKCKNVPKAKIIKKISLGDILDQLTLT